MTDQFKVNEFHRPEMPNADGNNQLISVIIPFYNREKMLAGSVESVIAQTYSHWELLLVDDGSIDGSVSIAKSYCERLPSKIRLIQQKNGGPGSARNFGIKNACGDFVAFLDSDDEYRPSFLAHMVKAIINSPQVDWIYCNVRRVKTSGEILVPSVFDDSSAYHFRQLNFIEHNKLRIIDDKNFLYTAIAWSIKEGANKVVRRKVFDNLSYNPEIRVGEDRLLNIEAISRGITFGYLNEILLDTHEHEDNISIHRKNSQSISKQLRIHRDLIRVYEIVGETIPLNKKEERGRTKRLANLYFWLGYLMVIHKKEETRGFVYMRKGLKLDVSNMSYWKSYLMSLLRHNLSIFSPVKE